MKSKVIKGPVVIEAKAKVVVKVGSGIKSITMFSVAVRESGGTYIARCEDSRASCTQGYEEAAKRAAAKAFKEFLSVPVNENQITLETIKIIAPQGEPSWYFLATFVERKAS